MRASLPRLVVAVPVALVVAGCGTTVPMSGVQGSADGLGQDAVGGAGGTGPASTGQARLTDPGAGSATADTRQPVGPSAVAAAQGAAGAVGGAVPRGAASPLLVGIPYAVNNEAANAAIGARGITSGDEKAEYSAVIADINAHGGVLGHKLVPVWHPVDASSAQNLSQLSQAACADFTQDHHVFAAVARDATDNLYQCLEHAGVAAIDGDVTDTTASVQRRFAHHVLVGSVTLTRAAAVEAEGLARAGYFGPRAKVGIVTYDDDRYGEALTVLLSGLSAQGVHVDPGNIQRVHRPNGTSDDGPTAAGMSNAVLKLNAAGVDHVLLFDHGGLITTLFATNARSQDYFPRYGLNSMNGAQALMDSGLLRPGDLRDAVGVGWLPLLDISYAENGLRSAYSNDARRHCTQVMAKAGVAPSSANNANVANSFCDELYFLRDALEAGGPSISPDSFLRGVAKLGSFPSGVTFRTQFSASQHDGVDAVRTFAFQDGCSCVRYTSGLLQLPRERGAS